MHTNRPTNHPSNNYGDMAMFRFFKMPASRHLEFSNSGNLTADELRWSRMHHITKFHQNLPSGCEDISISPVFPHDGRPPSWIWFPRFWTTNLVYLLVFTGEQNLVGIHAVISMIWTFEYFARLAWKCLSTPQSNGWTKSLNSYSLCGTWTPSNTPMLWPTPLATPNRIRIHSAVLPQGTRRTDRQTDR